MLFKILKYTCHAAFLLNVANWANGLFKYPHARYRTKFFITWNRAFLWLDSWNLYKAFEIALDDCVLLCVEKFTAVDIRIDNGTVNRILWKWRSSSHCSAMRLIQKWPDCAWIKNHYARKSKYYRINHRAWYLITTFNERHDILAFSYSIAEVSFDSPFVTTQRVIRHHAEWIESKEMLMCWRFYIYMAALPQNKCLLASIGWIIYLPAPIGLVPIHTKSV